MIDALTDDPPVQSTADRVKAAVAALEQQGAPPEAIHAYLEQQQAKAQPERPSLLSRVATNVGGLVKEIADPHRSVTLDALRSVGKSAYDTFASPVEGEQPSNDLAMIRGTDKPVTKATPGAISPSQFKNAATQTVVNAASAPLAGGVARLAGGGALAKLAGTAAAGSAAGAAYSPEDRVAGAVTGGIIAPAIHGAAKVIKPIATAVGGKAVDVVGRPTESVGPIEGVNERAARLNAPTMRGVDVPSGDKPLAPVDLGGIPAQRLARGLKTSSPAAEAVFRDALQPRAEGAVDRVIQHGLETTGLTSRENGLGVVDDMIAQRGQEAAGRYPKTFAKYPNPIDDPEFDAVAKTPAGQQALKRGMTIAKNRGEQMAEVDLGGGTPPGYSPEQWQHITETMKARGLPIPDVPGGETRIAPTLQQAHYIKLGFDDMLNSAPEPGSGGSGPNNAAAIRGLKNRWLAAMDKASPEYASDRKTYADQSDLVRGAELGRNLFKMHPQEAAKALAELPQAAQDVARRTGFDALAERIENGPTDVDKGLKVRDRQRMRLLFPDDASFEKFREGLKQEAQMHATNQGVLSGSVTADKLSDMADLAGVTLPDVLHAASGRVMPLLSKVARKVTVGKASVDAVNAERARLLVAGAGGSATDRASAMSRMQPPATPPRLLVPPSSAQALAARLAAQGQARRQP